MFAAGYLPVATSCVYQERVFGASSVNVLFMLSWCALFQFIVIAAVAILLLVFDNAQFNLSHSFERATACVRNDLADEPW